jgi:RsiW-degrading membrane proteinase PrsW (M82 family)
MNNNLLALAIIPGILIIAYVYKKDRVEKEPIGMIIRLVILGAFSCIPAAFFESLEAEVLPSYPKGSLEYALINAFAMAAFTEEIVKYLALRIGSWRSKAFNYRFDGVVYGVSAAVGFALFENVMYVSEYGLQTAIVRAFTAVPLHAFCGVFMGAFYSYAKKASIMGKSTFKYTLLALIVPMLIHGIYDTMAFMGDGAITYVFLIFVVLLYIIAISTIKKLSAADYRSGFYPEARSISYDLDI